jgi:mono/diheme cytochrome c family protein
MRAFALGVVFTLAALAIGIYEGARLGYIYLGADGKPTLAESTFAMSVLDASIDRHIPSLTNPDSPTEENIEAGAKVYLAHCAGCHGVPANPDSQFGRSFYPPVPQFFKDTPDMSETQNFYIVQHGIRWTGMPAFGATLSPAQIWQTIVFLSNISKLSPPARKIFDYPAASAPVAR